MMVATTTPERIAGSEFVAERISRSATIDVQAPIEKVFPLFGPVLEKEWADGWNPQIIFTTAENIEEHMIFRTPGKNSEEDFYTWAVTKYDPDNRRIEYTVSTAHRIWFIHVYCTSKTGNTLATITYTYTGLSAAGNEWNREALKNMFAEELKDWEREINGYLKMKNNLINKTLTL